MRIQATDLCKKFNRQVTVEGNKKKSRQEEFLAVNHVSLTARGGEILGVLGPNGAGKTTLLRMLGRLMQPTSGTVSVIDDNGAEMTNDIDVKRYIGYLSENTKLYKRLSVREMLKTIAEIYGLTQEETEQKIDQITEVLQLQGFIDNRIERLSTGQTQRASIARCLVHSPQIYIFDEPTLGLDILSSESIIEFMRSERERGRGVLYSTHYMEEAQYLCDRIVMIYQGQIIAEGTPQGLMEQTGTQNLRETFRALINQKEEQAVQTGEPDTGTEQTDGEENGEGEV